MADYHIGPNGLQFGGTPICATNLLFGDRTNPGLVLQERLKEQYFKGISKVNYRDMSVDDHMPMRASTSQRVDGVDDYRVAVGFDAIANSGGLVSMAQSTGAFDLNRQFVNRCGVFIGKDLAARGNQNAEACNPVIDGPMPYVGMENTGREPFKLQSPILPLCTQDFTNKDPGVWAKTLDALISVTMEGNLYRWQLGKLKWMISKSRYLASPIQESLGNGRAHLPISADLYSAYGFARVPQHWGSPDWISGMIRESEIPLDQDVTVEVPVAILMEYKQYYFQKMGFNLITPPTNLSGNLNGYFTDIQGESLIYRDPSSGRKITFKPTTRAVYVEVQETGPASGQWNFQERDITRDSEIADQVMPRQNPNWGVRACDGKTLAALVTITADGEKPFYTEPMPDNNPDAAVADVIRKWGGGKVNATLAQLYPSSMSLRLLTGLEAQMYLLGPLNQKYRDAGWKCDKFSNLMDTYVGGFVTIGGVFVENRPREVIQLLLKMPPQANDCVDLSVAYAGPDYIPAGIDLDPVVRAETFAEMDIPAPPAPSAAPAGTIRALARTKNVKAPCPGQPNKVVTLAFERVGGTAGTLALAIAGSASAHASGLPTTVSFADGVSYQTVTFEVTPWACTDPDAAPANENFVLTLGPANLTVGAYNTIRVCITCNKGCASGVCEPIEGSCESCG